MTIQLKGDDREAATDEPGQIRLAALLYLLSQPAAAGPLRSMVLDHLDMIAADPHAAPLVRVTCARIARQWSESPDGYRH